MRGITHPSIIKLLSFSESPDHFFLVLERMCTTTVTRVGCFQTLFYFDQSWRVVNCSIKLSS